MEIEFKWEDVCLPNNGFTQRAKVYGGWVIRCFNYGENEHAIALTFISDSSHIWETKDF